MFDKNGMTVFHATKKPLIRGALLVELAVVMAPQMYESDRAG
jgi:hypothetical protein